MDGLIAYGLAKKYTDSVGEKVSREGFHVQVEQDRSILNSTGQEKIFYFLPKTSDNPTDGYDEFVYANNNWEQVGVTDIDLSSYATKVEVGDLANLPTTDKSSIVSAISETFTSVSNGKSLVASAITDKGVSTSSDATFEIMAQNIEAIPSSDPIFEQIVNRTATSIVDSGEVRYLLTQMFCQMEQVIGVILNSNPLYIGGPQMSGAPERVFDNCLNLKFAITPHLAVKYNNFFGSYTFQSCTNLKLIVLNTMGANPQGSMYVGAINIKSLVIPNSAVIPLTNTNTFRDSAISSGTCSICIPDSLKENYKTTTNWSVYANQFIGYSETPNYKTDVIYTIGDLCKYDNKLYAWINETDGNSTPFGEIDDHDDWYCIAEIEEGWY